MSRLDEATDARLYEIRDLVRSGATEMVGRTYREYEHEESGERGKVAGRFKGGFGIVFPELKRSGHTPGEAAKAIERGRGKVYNRIRKAVRSELRQYIPRGPRKRYPERPVIPAHS